MKRLLPILALVNCLCVGFLAREAGGHSGDLAIGSDANGGGSLKIDYDFARNIVGLSYTGFSTLFEATDPGFTPAETEPPDIYELLLNTEVYLEVIHLDPGVTLELRSTLITAPGSYLIGTHDQTGANIDNSDIHQHPAFRLLLNASGPHYFGEGLVVFRVIEGSSSHGYSPSPTYVLRLSNGYLEEVSFGSGPEIDQASIRCQYALGLAQQKYFVRVQSELRKCLDRVVQWKARDVAGHPSALAALARAEKACADAAGSGPDARTLLGRLDALEKKVVSDVQMKCGLPGGSTLDGRTIPSTATNDWDVISLRTHFGMVRCRAEELLGAGYPGAPHELETFTARPSQGGNPLPEYFPCLRSKAEGH